MTLTIVGSGGHAKVVIATARAAGHDDLILLDDAPARVGQVVSGLTVRGGSASVLADPTAQVVLAIGDNRTRLRLAAGARCGFATLVHPRAIVDPSVTLGPGTVVFAGAIVQPDSRLGAHVIVNTGAQIDHDGDLGDGVHLAPSVTLAGSVTVEQGAFLGVGVKVIPGRRIGAWTTVGAGAVVVADLGPGLTAVGVPARPR